MTEPTDDKPPLWPSRPTNFVALRLATNECRHEPRPRLLFGDSITRFDEQRGCWVHELIRYDADGKVTEHTIREL